MTAVADKYFARYAEPEVGLLSGFPEYHYRHTLVVPIYHETADFLSHLLAKTQPQGPVLIILVVNAPAFKGPDARQQQTLSETRQLLHSLTTENTLLWRNGSPDIFLCEYYKNPAYHLLILDRCTPNHEIPEQEGVGLARKIGADLACYLIQRKQVATPWIYSTDADVILPTNYFNTEIDPDFSAGVFPFRHECREKTLTTAMALYQTRLDYYVAGLKWAGSPYAYQTIGSTLVINAVHYCHVRGFPKRSGGEDFYLLNKLNKVAPVKSLNAPQIVIDGRPSQRVPFGTGPALREISRLHDPEREYLYYHPQVFVLLKRWLSLWPALWEVSGNMTQVEALISGQRNGPTLWTTLTSLKVKQAIEHAHIQCKDQGAFMCQMHIWFDAFRTLKFIHFLRDRYYPSAPLAESVKQTPFEIEYVSAEPR